MAFLKQSLTSLLAFVSMPFLLGQTASTTLTAQNLKAIGSVEERFQSYNVEMIEVTGGRFWAPYQAQASAPVDTQQPTPGRHAGLPLPLSRSH